MVIYTVRYLICIGLLYLRLVIKTFFSLEKVVKYSVWAYYFIKLYLILQNHIEPASSLSHSVHVQSHSSLVFMFCNSQNLQLRFQYYFGDRIFYPDQLISWFKTYSVFMNPVNAVSYTHLIMKTIYGKKRSMKYKTRKF